MSQSNNVCSVKEYFQKGTFIIPNYQRGFKWGVPSKTETNKEGTEAVGVLMNSLFHAFQQNKLEYFLQGITVVEKENKEIVLIDGQQRTTTLFILLAFINAKIGGLTEYIERNQGIAIRYDIRESSHKYLEELSSVNYKIAAPDSNVDAQDIFYFKKAINTIQQEWNFFYTDTKKNKAELLKDEPIANSPYYTALSKFKDSSTNESKLLEAFKEYLLERVKMLYIPIDANKATTIFKMMNGQKAEMKVEELIKSAILSQSSRVTKTIDAKGNDVNALLLIVKEKVGEEWEINALRSKYAREWDKWLYWWNQKDVAEYFGTGREPMGLLLEYFYYCQTKKENYSKGKRSVGETFDAFKTAFLTSAKEAKNNFGRIRKLQKTFEDWYNDPKTYNSLGLILKCAGSYKKEALTYLIQEALKGELEQKKLSRFGNYMLVGATSNEIIDTLDNLKVKAQEVLNILSASDVYNERNEEGEKDDRKEMAFRQLLRINMEMDSSLDRKFDFKIWNTRSLEHVHPKSKVYKVVGGKNIRCTDSQACKPDSTFINRASFSDDTSEHCIGNLFLLSGRNNSKFGNNDFNKKKELLFSVIGSKKDKDIAKDERGNILESIKLLHTASAFAENEWTTETIRKRKLDFITKFSDTYSLTQKQ